MLTRLFEDDLILAIHKESGLPSHSQDEAQDSVESRLRAEQKNVPVFLLHRLDTGTSGVLLFAKNELIFNEMRELFKLKKIQKQYVAWTEITPERTALLRAHSLPYRLDWPLAHHAKSKKRMIAIPPEKHRHIRGKPIPALSILHSAREGSFSGIPAYELEVEIVTGVMHQIRVHLASLGLPLIGDAVYEKTERVTKPRLALHARSISFELLGFCYVLESPSV